MEKKVKFEQNQLWEKEAKAQVDRAEEKRQEREGARPLSRGFHFWDVNFFNHMFFFSFSFQHTAFFECFRFLYYQE